MFFLDKSLKIRKAEQIFSQHLASDAPEPVNIDSGTVALSFSQIRGITCICGHVHCYKSEQITGF